MALTKINVKAPSAEVYQTISTYDGCHTTIKKLHGNLNNDKLAH
jgi:hypothetical protein